MNHFNNILCQLPFLFLPQLILVMNGADMDLHKNTGSSIVTKEPRVTHDG